MKLNIEFNLTGTLSKIKNNIYKINTSSDHNKISFMYRKRTVNKGIIIRSFYNNGVYKGDYIKHIVSYNPTYINYYRIPIKLTKNTQVYINGKKTTLYFLNGVCINNYTATMKLIFTGIKFECSYLD